jgi:hypothetical protein
MWSWITIDFFVIFGGAALSAYFFERAVAALAPVFTREREEDNE